MVWPRESVCGLSSVCVLWIFHSLLIPRPLSRGRDNVRAFFRGKSAAWLSGVLVLTSPPPLLLCRDDMTREEAIAIVAKAIRSGIFNDLGSGSNVDLCVISEGGNPNAECVMLWRLLSRWPFAAALSSASSTRSIATSGVHNDVMLLSGLDTANLL